MVTQTDTTEIITEPKLSEKVSPSFGRWLKHFFYMPASKRYFSKTDQQAIAEAVKKAEFGHVGEIQVVIEGHIPCSTAYYHNTRLRAQQLFAELGIWDTEFNSVILLYLNLCEKNVEIVIDRGIHKSTNQAQWDAICQQITAELSKKNYRNAVIQGVEKIGKILSEYYDAYDVDKANEIDNSPIILN